MVYFLNFITSLTSVNFSLLCYGVLDYFNTGEGHVKTKAVGMINCLCTESACLFPFPWSCFVSTGCVLYIPIPEGLIGPGVALDMALSMCSTESKLFIAAVISLGQHRVQFVWTLSNGEMTVVLKKNPAFIVWNSRHFHRSLRSWQAICAVAGTEKMTLFFFFFSDLK